MTFEWDDDKVAENERKHDGVTFKEAPETFLDANAVEDYDDEHSDMYETRFLRIGNSSKRPFRVSFTVHVDESDDEIIRTISVRKGGTNEEEIYYEQNR